MDFSNLDELNKKRLRAAIALGLWIAQAAYILFPFDLLPDFIPVIGWLDDLATLGSLGATSIWMIRLVQDVGIRELFGLQADAIESVEYEPIPMDVLNQM